MSYINLGDGSSFYWTITLILIRFIIYRIFAIHFGHICREAAAVVLLLLLLLLCIWATLIGFVH